MHPCTLCQHKFACVKTLNRHLKEIHGEEPSPPPPKRARPNQDCDVCNKSIFGGNLSAHKKTIEHRNNLATSSFHIDSDDSFGDVTVVKSAFRSRLATLRINASSSPVNIPNFLEEVKSKLTKIWRYYSTSFPTFKTHLELFVNYFNQTSGVESIKSHNTKTIIVDQGVDLAQTAEDFIEKILKKSQDFNQKESGWSFLNVKFLEISINKFNPLRVSSWLPIPAEITHKKAVVNIKNHDQECFKWAILAHLHPIHQHPERVHHYTSPVADTSDMVLVPDENPCGEKECESHESPTASTSGIVLVPDEDYWGTEEYDSIMQHQLYIEKVSPTPPKITFGNRIVNLDYVLKWALPLQNNHSKTCTGGILEPYAEDSRGKGLVTIITFKCNVCDLEISHSTEDPQKKVSVVNTAAVWGTLASGSSYGQTQEWLSIMNIPKMPFYMFQKIEEQLGHAWKDSLWESMEQAGREELALALETNNVDSENSPWATVYLDGGWSKRSYGHTYSAASGTAVIIGKATGKVLFVGIRNKYCTICARAANKKEPVGNHRCYRNWSGSSPAMEADIIVEAFNCSETMHGLKYLKFVADGDSSVFAKIRQNVLYGRHVEKVECTNHAVKNYGKCLYKARTDDSVDSAGKKLLTNAKVKELENFVQTAIHYNTEGVEELKEELQVGPFHTFGDHSKCKEHFCNSIGDMSKDKTQLMRTSGLLRYILGALDGLMKKVHKLIADETNNKAELFMAILAKFNCGKRLNLTQKQSFQIRSYLTGLRYNGGLEWQRQTWKDVVGESPGCHFKKFINKYHRNQESRTKRRLKFEEEQAQGRIKSVKPSERQGKMPEVLKNQDYGPKSLQAPLSKVEFDSECQRILQSLQVTSERQNWIEANTKGQFDNNIYLLERRNRQTASKFGEICRRRPSTSCHTQVKSIVYPPDIRSEAMDFGKHNERYVIEKFMKQKNVEVQRSGLFVDVENGFLAASPDGLISDGEVVEVKCLYSVYKKKITLRQALSEKSHKLCVSMDPETQTISLNRNHRYYYQIQGQLNIAQRELCHFIIYVGEQDELFIEEIRRDEDFWEKEMKPNLVKFYKDCILREIVQQNVVRGERCEDPEYILECQNARKGKTIARKKLE